MTMASGDYFLKIDGIEGESQDDQHRDEIDVLSFSWSEQNPAGQEREGSGAGPTAVAGRVTMRDFVFTMRTNKASPKLPLAVASGQRITSAVMTARRAAQDLPFLTYTLSDVLVSSYETEASVLDQPPVDQVSLHFGKIEVEYRPQQPDGALGPSIQVGWDAGANRAVSSA
jgi:type VI secretion system secreted protein Hcp